MYYTSSIYTNTKTEANKVWGRQMQLFTYELLQLKAIYIYKIQI
jgi:hypothetical protein